MVTELTQQKLLLLSTGGTIASVISEEGLAPGESGEDLLKMVGNLPYQIDVKDIFKPRFFQYPTRRMENHCRRHLQVPA